MIQMMQNHDHRAVMGINDPVGIRHALSRRIPGCTATQRIGTTPLTMTLRGIGALHPWGFTGRASRIPRCGGFYGSGV